ncbi:FAD-dependent oxidoreductase [Bordetella pertussis]
MAVLYGMAQACRKQGVDHGRRAAPFAGGVRGPQQCVRAAQSGRCAALAAGVPGRAQAAGAGGGYIGLETAAVAAQAGLSVQVVERASRVLERVACPATAAAIRALHQRHGVLIHEGRTVAGTEGDEALTGVELDNGLRIACDLVVAGVGVAPQTALAEAAGIDCDDGILVDAYGRTSAPDVWAAGDCARFVLGGEPARLESVQNAIDQAEAVADDMLGRGGRISPSRGSGRINTT